VPSETKPVLHKKVSTIILAAGVGKRMHSRKPKILHKILGKPIISFVVDLAQDVGSNEIILVVGKNNKRVRKVFRNRVRYAVQPIPQGTGDAAKKGIKVTTNRDILLLCGDVPFLAKATIEKLMAYHKRSKADLTLLSCEVTNPFGYGRILRNNKGKMLGIIEQSDSSIKQQKIREINAGVYYGKKQFIRQSLRKINNMNRQKEYYLTDVVSEMLKNKKKVVAYKIRNEEEIMGINSKSDLARAKKIAKVMGFEQTK
jgi:bifunctional UDP-N-acetylglucosamine pyrophosphorylase/glucosamine-1-phosphate N-acetyltransferase